MKSHCPALREASRRRSPFPKGQCDPTSTCHSVSTNHGCRAGRFLSARSPHPAGRKSYRSLVSLCRVPHDTAWVLCGVSTAALQTQAVPRTQPAYTHLALRSISELPASRHGRSAWELALPLGHYTFKNLLFCDSLESRQNSSS